MPSSNASTFDNELVLQIIVWRLPAAASCDIYSSVRFLRFLSNYARRARRALPSASDSVALIRASLFRHSTAIFALYSFRASGPNASRIAALFLDWALIASLLETWRVKGESWRAHDFRGGALFNPAHRCAAGPDSPSHTEPWWLQVWASRPKKKSSKRGSPRRARNRDWMRAYLSLAAWVPGKTARVP